MLVRVFDGKDKGHTKVKTDGNRKCIRGFPEWNIFLQRCRLQKNFHQEKSRYVIAVIKSATDTKILDTITDARQPCFRAILLASKDIKPMVFQGLYPTIPHRSMKPVGMHLINSGRNDSSFNYEPETSLCTLVSGFQVRLLGGCCTIRPSRSVLNVN